MPDYCLLAVSKSAIKPKVMITAKELFDKMIEENDECTSTEMMIRFAKLHVTKALKQASKEAINDLQIQAQWLNKNAILNAYPLDGIV
jgi:uncharacterized protein YbjQ (UPF0145 family)